MTHEPVIRFGEFELDRRTLELRRGTTPVKLQQQPARVLEMLASRGGELVTREELRRAIWGEETFVEFDSSLNYCISQIRSALGETSDGPKFIETLRGRGYRFIAPPSPPQATRKKWPALAVVAVLIAAFAAAIAWMIVRSNRTPSIVVVPFASTRESSEWSTSLHAELVNQLSSSTGVKVIGVLNDESARSRWRLEGRIDRSPSQFRVIAVLRDTKDDAVRWTDTYESTPGDWLDVQYEIAQNITRAVLYFTDVPGSGLPMRHKIRRHLPFVRKK